MENTATGLIGPDLIRQQIHEYVVMNFLFDGSGAQLDDDTPLVEANVVDQTGLLELALFLEETYGVHVDETDFTPENFDSVNALAYYTYMRLANS